MSCTVTHCVVHHKGDLGIGILGKEKTEKAPLITDNFVYCKMGGGIGVAEGAEPIIQGNTCKENLRAGIGCRKAKTRRCSKSRMGTKSTRKEFGTG